jgi:hypothetical protein
MADETASTSSTITSPAKSAAAFAVGERVATADGTEYVIVSVVPEAFRFHVDPKDTLSATYPEDAFVLLPASLLTHPQPASTLTRVS